MLGAHTAGAFRVRVAALAGPSLWLDVAQSATRLSNTPDQARFEAAEIDNVIAFTRERVGSSLLHLVADRCHLSFPLGPTHTRVVLQKERKCDCEQTY